MAFPVVTYGCESWTIKKAECQRIDAFELWCWRRLLRVPWTARRSNQSILKEISPGCSLEGLMLKLKLQYFGHQMWRADSLEKTLMLGKIEGRKRRGQQRMRWLDGIINAIAMNLGKLRVMVRDRKTCHAAVLWVRKSQTRLGDWTNKLALTLYSYSTIKWKWSEVTQSCLIFETPWTVAHQAPPSTGFSRQEYWSGLPFPSPGDLPNQGIEPRSPSL